MREMLSTSPVSTIEEYIMLASLYWQKSVFVYFLHRITEGGAGHIRQLAASHHDRRMTVSLWQYDRECHYDSMTECTPQCCDVCSCGQLTLHWPGCTLHQAASTHTQTHLNWGHPHHLQSILYTCRYLHRYKPLKLSTICVPHAGFTFVEVKTLFWASLPAAPGLSRQRRSMDPRRNSTGSNILLVQQKCRLHYLTNNVKLSCEV